MEIHGQGPGDLLPQILELLLRAEGAVAWAAAGAAETDAEVDGAVEGIAAAALEAVAELFEHELLRPLLRHADFDMWTGQTETGSLLLLE